MIFSTNQIIYLCVNIAIIFLAAGLTFLVIKLLKIKDKSSILLFILYIVYWIAPLVTRDYTGLIQIHMNINNGVLMFIPIIVYGLIGIFYRPLSDFMALRMKSRKNVIYISLALQAAMAIPFFAYPCFATNVVQSLGAGIGASCIGLFNLMFNEHDTERKIVVSVSILVIPPLIAQFFASGFICIIVSIVHSTHTGIEYVDIVKYLWLVAIVMIVVGFILTIFIKEKGATLYRKSHIKQQVSSKRNWAAFILLCVAAACISFIKWATGGATASVQIAYIANKTGMDTRAYEGYASLIGSIGQILGVLLSSLWLMLDHKTKHIRIYLMSIALVIGIIYFVISSVWVNIPMFIASAVLNGMCYGIFTNVLLGIIITKAFSSHQKVVTPVGVYNTSLAFGILTGTFTNTYIKQGIFDQMHGFSTYSFKDFKTANWTVNNIAMAILVAGFVCYIVSFVINKKTKSKKVRMNKEFAVTSDTEM